MEHDSGYIRLLSAAKNGIIRIQREARHAVGTIDIHRTRDGKIDVYVRTFSGTVPRRSDP